MGNVLEKICADKREHIKKQKRDVSESELLDKIKGIGAKRPFFNVLSDAVNKQQNALIAEIKKASPSKGIIRADFNPGSIAKQYEAGGATCISVLTDIPYFQGNDDYIIQAKNACNLPILRKDFMLDPYQVIEAKAIGADCILLIMAALSKSQAQELEAAATELDLDVLTEVHNEQEIEQAMQLKGQLIGINNRDLKTLKVDLATSERLCKVIPKSHKVVCESGVFGYNDVKRMNESNIYAFLVGESLMKQHDITASTKALLHSE